MRCGRTFRFARTHPVCARSSGSETLSRSRYLVGCTIDMHESELSEATGMVPASAMPNMPHLFAEHEVARCGGYVAHFDYRYRNSSHGHFDDGAGCYGYGPSSPGLATTHE